jgi:hypothetical protein
MMKRRTTRKRVAFEILLNELCDCNNSISPYFDLNAQIFRNCSQKVFSKKRTGKKSSIFDGTNSASKHILNSKNRGMNSNEVQAPDSYFCPISGEVTTSFCFVCYLLLLQSLQLMKDPVVDAEGWFALVGVFFFFSEKMTRFSLSTQGNTYDRVSIEAWLAKSQTSPVTRSPLFADKLAPNRALKEAIDAFRAANPNHVPSVAPKPLAQGNIAVSVQAFARVGKTGTHDIVVTLDAGPGKSR